MCLASHFVYGISFCPGFFIIILFVNTFLMSFGGILLKLLCCFFCREFSFVYENFVLFWFEWLSLVTGLFVSLFQVG